MSSLLLSIPGVSLQIWKQDRELAPEEDGYLGELSSGYVVITAEPEHKAPIIGLAVKGRDEYVPVKDVNSVEAYLNWAQRPKAERNLERLHEWLERSKDKERIRVYGKKVGLQAYDPFGSVKGNPQQGGGITVRRRRGSPGNKSNGFAPGERKPGQPFVTYPENLLCLAEVVREDGRYTNQVRVWRVSVVSQDGHFYVAVQKAYEAACYSNAKDGSIIFPRFTKHDWLNDALVDLVPDGTHVPSLDEYEEEKPPRVRFSVDGEGVVTSFYEARGIGTVLTRDGAARVHWTDCPARPRRRYLVVGERIRARYDTPKMTVRSSDFERQAYEVSLLNSN